MTISAKIKDFLKKTGILLLSILPVALYFFTENISNFIGKENKVTIALISLVLFIIYLLSRKSLEKRAKDAEVAFKLLFRKEVPEISWENDGFAYMTVESRFKDNFNKSGLKFNIEELKPRPKDQYSYFVGKTVLDENKLKSIFPDKNDTSDFKVSPKDDYCNRYKQYMKEMLTPYKEKKQSYLFSKAPFLFSEHYYFYSILYYFRDGDNKNKDPWEEAKRNHYKEIKDKRIANIVKETDLGEILKNCVNNNSTDLSQNQQNIGSYTENTLVIDDIERFKGFVNKNNLYQKDVHIIVDNCGIELISDLRLGIFLIEQFNINKLYLHFNILPIFVSDVIKKDIEDTLELIERDEMNPERKDIVAKYRKYRDERLIIESADVFWNMPILFKDAPEFIMHDIFNAASTGLLIFKGDLNYRRLIGDRKWKTTSTLEKHVKYIQKPVLILRSLKSNVLLGIDKKTIAQKDEAYPNWKTTGDFGIIQFIEKP